MSISRIAVLLLVLGTAFQAVAQQQSINRDRYYSAIRGKDLAKLDQELQSIQTQSFKGQPAFVGAMMMKKADLIKGPAAKLRIFKRGGKQLEAEIGKEPGNVEYRFLRLIIQEHAPGIVNYHDDISGDKQMIISAYKQLPAELQKVVNDYSQTSKALSGTNF